MTVSGPADSFGPVYVAGMADSVMQQDHRPVARFSVPSIVAGFSVVAAYWMGDFPGFVAALLAIGFGVIGMIFALSPKVRGGIVSLLSVIGGGLAVLLGVLRLIF